MAGLTITEPGVYDGAGTTVDFVYANDITGNITISNYKILVANADDEGLKLESITGDITVDSCSCIGGTYGCWIDNSAITSDYTVSISNCYFCPEQYDGYGMDFYDISELHLLNNTILGGIEIYDCGTIAISNNNITCQGRDGIDIYDCVTATISDNNITCQGYGIFIYDCVTATISSNNVISQEEGGTYIEDCGTVIVVNNYISGNSTTDEPWSSGLEFYDSQSVTVRNNYIIGQYDGISAAVWSIPGAVANIVNNIIVSSKVNWNNWGGCLDIREIANLKIINNTIIGGNYGIAVGDITSSLCIKNNILYGAYANRDLGIELRWGNVAPAVSNNCFYGWNKNYDAHDGMPDPPSVTADPLFVSSPTYTGIFPNGYFLSQIAAGEAADSPCVDAGFGSAIDYPYDGSMI